MRIYRPYFYKVKEGKQVEVCLGYYLYKENAEKAFNKKHSNVPKGLRGLQEIVLKDTKYLENLND